MAPTPPANRDDPGKDGSDQDVGSMEMPQHVINAGSSSDSEDSDEGADPSYQGYQLLPQEPDTTPSQDIVIETTSPQSSSLPCVSQPQSGPAAAGEDRVQEMVSQLGVEQVDQELHRTIEKETHCVSLGAGSSLFQQVPEAKSSEAQERRELWQKPQKSHTSQPMPQEEAAQIKAAMAGFSLPSSHTPAWARTVSEDDWKIQLLSRLGGDSPPTASHHQAVKGGSDRDTGGAGEAAHTSTGKCDQGQTATQGDTHDKR